MTRGILRSLVVALCTLAAGGAMELVRQTVFCPRHRAFERVRDNRSAVVLDSGYRFALPTESIYVCETPHRIGPLRLHADLDCYCAPAPLGALNLGRELGGECVVDHVMATRADETGACRHAHCRELDDSP